MFSVQTSSFVFLQREKNLKSIIIIGLSTILTMSAVYAFLASKEINLEGMAKILLIPDIITALICLISTKKYWLELNINIFNVLKKTKKILMSLFLSGSITLTIVLYSRLDLILVRPYLGFEEQAVYSYAFRFVEPFSICFSLLALSLLAEMSAVKNILITGKYKNFIRKYLSKKYVILFIFLNVLLALFLCGIAEKFLAFNNHKILIFSLAMVIFIKFINTIFSTYFLRKQNYIYLLKISVINLFVIFFMGLILGFSFGNTGIALASIIGEATIFFLQRKALVSKL
jgi:O-antigen/teichoic acid export membrane protein